MLLRFGLALVVIVAALGAATARPTATDSPGAEEKRATEPRRGSHRSRAAITAQPSMVPPLPERKTAKASPVPPVPDTWSQAELDAAKAQCAAVLKSVDAEVSFEEPIKEGLCGTPAPIRLSRLGKVTFTPAALVNCGLLKPLDTWLTQDVQPAAKRRLGSRVTDIEVMSDYSCRTAFGRVGRRLSQHAYVDALDIRGFVTESGKRVHVLDGWGATKRDLVVAAKKAEAAEQAALAEAERQASSQAEAPAFGTTTTTRTADSKKPVTRAEDGKTSTVAANAARLGGPALTQAERKKAAPVREKAKQENITAASLTPAALGLPPVGADGRFLREAHAAACRIFGTTLGPEANEAHRNHFHVDMAQRRIKNICD